MENEKFEEQNIAQEQDLGEELHAEYAAETAATQEEMPSGTGRKESPFANAPYEMNFDYEPSYGEKPKKVKKARTGRGKRVLASVTALALLVGSCGITAAVVNNRWEKKTKAMEQTINQKLLDLQTRVEEAGKISGGVTVVDSLGNMSAGGVYNQNVDAVVLISCQVAGTSYFGQATTGTSTGTGFIITEDGYVVTNYHVVEGASKIFVNTHDGNEFAAVLVGQDKTNDVAVLKMEDATGLPYVTLGSSTELSVGDQVVAIGNPLGDLTATLTVGYVSAKDRDVTTEGATINMIQTDAAINSGNSGGPLFNMKGEVVGITTAKYSGLSASGASIEGIGFAIPMDDAAGIIDDLMEFGYVRSAYLGITVYSVLPSDAEMFGRPLGCLVNEVTPGSCAAIAGLKKADVITGLGGYKVDSYTDLARALRSFNGGETTTITVDRGGQTLVMEITLDEKPHEGQNAPSSEPSNMPDNGSYEEWFDYFFGE